MSPATIAFATPAALPAATRAAAAPAVTRVTPRASDDGPTRGENGISANFAPPRRFVAPKLSLHDTGIELVNTLGLVMEPVELDLAHAADLLADARGANVDDMDTLTATLFAPPVHAHVPAPDASVSDRCFPIGSRDDAPIIQLESPTDTSPGAIRVSVGKVRATVPVGLDGDAPSPLAAGADAHPDPAASVVERNFPANRRNVAPLIELASGELGVSLCMTEVTGDVEAPAYPRASRFVAPKIEIKAPAGDWDSSAFVAVTDEEVELPLLQALSIGK